MKLDEVVAWYQKKIGTYDKQQWEKTVEQNILDGLSSVQLKTAKLKTELIDVDLVRGSTFPKAKPKQSLFTVIRLAILRYLFLPLYAQWWVKQTSPNGFAILLTLYMLQMINLGVYTLNIHKLDANRTTTTVHAENTTANNNDGVTENIHNNSDEVNNIISLSELLIPMCLSLLLSLIHSQIVATNTASGSSKSKHRRFSNASAHSKAPRDSRMRRRKKLVRLRSHDSTDTSVQQQQNQQQTTELLRNMTSTQTSCEYLIKTTPLSTTTQTAMSAIPAQNEKSADIEIFPLSTVTVKKIPKLMQLDLKNTASCSAVNEQINTVESAKENISPKKRNVNWHSPIHKYASEMLEKQQQTSPQSMSSSSSSLACNNVITTTTSETNSPQHLENAINDNFANQPSSSLSPPISTTQPQLVEVSLSPVEGADVPIRRNLGEDDGFESLNGKSSSGEENICFLSQSTYQGGVSNTQLRQRLHAVAAHSNNNDCERDSDAANSGHHFRRNINKCGLEPETYQLNKVARSSKKTSSSELDEEGDYETELVSSPASLNNTSLNYNECTTSATEWLGVTTNSEECSYSSELEQSDGYKGLQISDGDGYDADYTPALLLNSHGVTDRISCTIWEQREIKKAQLSVLQISSCILERVEAMPETNDYVYLGICFAFILSILPCFCRLCEATLESMENVHDINILDVPKLFLEKNTFSCANIVSFAFGNVPWQRTVLIIACLQRFSLSLLLFIIFSVAERTFKQRFLYAKLFSHLTSSRRARKSNLPHFRLNKVRNIKTWLSVRSYLKKRGPQRSVDVIVSAAFIVTLLLLAFLSVEWLKDSVQLHSQLNLEALLWATFVGIYLLRFMTLGNKIHEKYRSISVLITEQINLYLQIEQKPKKKEELMVANSVLKLAADLLKELEAPFKISGLCANPYLFTTMKVVILSALSGVLSEMLGFKLKLHKIKIK